jgi:hypothetical protein
MSESTGQRTPNPGWGNDGFEKTGQHVNRGNAIDNGQRTVGTAGNSVGPRERGGEIAGRDTAPDYGKSQRTRD